MHLFLYLSILILLNKPSSISNNVNRISTHSGRDSLIIPKDPSSYYFPLNKKDQNSSLDSNALDIFLNTWYSKVLFALHEPVLFTYSGNKEIFRFTWLRTFHNPVVVRIQKDENNFSLNLKVSNGAGGYKPGEIIIDTTLTINKTQWEEFLKKFDAINFWNFPALENDRGFDGSEWILEAVQKNKYHFATRWSAGYTEFGKCCAYLLDLSQLKIPGNEKY